MCEGLGEHCASVCAVVCVRAWGSVREGGKAHESVQLGDARECEIQSFGAEGSTAVAASPLLQGSLPPAICKVCLCETVGPWASCLQVACHLAPHLAP